MVLMRRTGVLFFAAGLIFGLGMLAIADERPSDPVQPRPDVNAKDAEAHDVAEARLRSRLLHETIHGSLQVVHRDFFREGKRLPIPAKSLEDVFSELDKGWQVKVRWLVVNADAMNVEHLPKTAFDEQAVKAISDGKEMFEATDGGVYQYAGQILLGNQCLKCHVSQRTTLEDRKAAVVISMPLKIKERSEK